MIGRTLRPRRVVPGTVLTLLVVTLALQFVLAASQPRALARAAELEPPPSGPSLALLQGFEPLSTAHLMVLYLQAFDNQPGISIPFRDLDYSRVIEWLRAALRLDPAGQYPLLLATQVYSQVLDPARQRLMLEFAYEQFLLDPERRWRWLAHGAILAKHRLHDLPLALKFAAAVAEKSSRAPPWARQMHIFLLEDMGEFEAARVLLGGLLASGTVTDLHERLLLLDSLERLEAAENSARPTKK